MTAPTQLEVLKARLVLALDQQVKVNAQVTNLTAEIAKLEPKIE